MKKITTKMLVLCAMFIALQVVLSKFLMVQLTPSIRLSIDSVPILLAGLWFGPFVGGIVGGFADILGTILFPTAGAYYPPLTLGYILIGILSGLLRKRIKSDVSIRRIATIILPSEIIGSLLWKSLALSWLVGIPFTGILAMRILPTLSIAMLNTLLVYCIHRFIGTRILAKPVAATIEKSPSTHAMTYAEALDYIHHVTWRGSNLGLERTRELLDRVGHPEKGMKIIHVAGTNGKGSTVVMLSAILQQSGYKVGMYTSPYINRFNERMAINGEPIADDELAMLTEQLKPAADVMADHPTEFELITVIALQFFQRHDCDIVVLEVGMGGELDSTNVIDVPELAIITNIGLDHTRELGPTITDIANAKAGIIKEGGDVVIYGLNEEADAVFFKTCELRHAHLVVTDHTQIHNVSVSLDHLTFDFGEYKALNCGLIGSYQVHNAAVVLTAVELLRKKGWQLAEAAVRAGLSRVKWPARFEILQRNPLFIADGGHNPQGIEAAIDSIRMHFPDRKLVFLLGIMADKDIPHMIEQLGPVAKEFITVTPDNPRAMPAEELAVRLFELGYTASACENVKEGVLKSIQTAGENGIVCALGSLYMLGDVRACLHVK
ncbi:MAG: folate family ECF transporter S component [Clostridia bacterium]